ncbi:MAG: hypothetical protein EU539_13000 [Promethearchaeota archaeon]|nr:MAG: hypothetical protein EU539_13000 [Candidatus Lokiarchaeota archaeon]
MKNSGERNNQESTDGSNVKGFTKNEIGKVHKFFLYARSFFPLFLSHHPECEKFGDNHTINIGKYRFCIGCFIGYPAAFVSLFLINSLDLKNSFLYSYFLPVSIFFLATFILSPLKLTENKRIKILQKIFIGMGAALLFSWIMGLPNPPRTNYNIAFAVIFMIVTILNIYHSYGFLNTCYKCETPFDWGRCDGFKTIRNNIEKYNLFNFLKNLDDFSQKIKERKKEKLKEG